MAKRTNNDIQNTTEKQKIKLQETHQKSGVIQMGKQFLLL